MQGEAYLAPIARWHAGRVPHRLRGVALLVLVLVALALFVAASREEDAPPRRPATAAGGQERETTTLGRRPAPLGDVAARITGGELAEHLSALQRIADAHGGNRAAGTAGERATADYIAARLRAAGYRVTLGDVLVPAFRERAAARLTSGGRGYRARTLRFSGGGTAAGTVRRLGLACASGDLAGLRRGEIALIERGTCTFRAKALAAQRAGAVAVLIADAKAVSGTLGRPGVRVPVVAISDAAAGQLAGARAQVRVDAEVERRRSANVVAETGAAGARRVVMAGAHLDSVPDGPGLNDTGSGVAALLEIAEQLGGRRAPAGTALRFAFWGAEEVGLLGSRRYVAGLEAHERRRIVAYVNLDMVGSPGGEPAVYPDDPAIAAALRRRLGRNPPERDLGGASDHAPFAAAGIPVGGLFTGLDDCYHERCDTQANVDRAVLTRSTRAAGAALVALARR
jgi:Zn-dependent M28 family amino/carboxypeptidase